MKEIKCSTCHKEIEVRDDYALKTCQNCLTNKKARDIKVKELRKLDPESKQQIKSLKLTKLAPIFKNYSTYATSYQKRFKAIPSFDDYLKALRQEKLRQAHDEADRLKREQKRKNSIMPDENWGRDVLTTSQTPQYPSETESSMMGVNAFHDLSEFEQPKPRKSNQDIFHDEFGDRSE